MSLVGFLTVWALIAVATVSGDGPQQRLKAPGVLKGKFLHITDLHPDFNYVQNRTVDSACHWKPRHDADDDQKLASQYGDAMMGCDSPYSLVLRTLEWINDNLKDEIDFIIWTGDNVRHDNDRQIPRTESEIFDSNANISQLMASFFKNHETLDPRDYTVPLIPSLGNNDVYPHNLFAIGPTLQSRLLHQTWASYVPQEQGHVFEKLATYLVEIVPDKLAVISLNTLYLFKSNPLVDNCDNRKQPGYNLMLWLGYTLKELRRRGMKVWISGHVPPVPKNYDLSCYRKYILWAHEFRDIIVGGLFGHMNLDHFVPLNAKLALQSVNEDTSMPGYDPETDAKFSRNEFASLGAAPGLNKLDYMESVCENLYADLDPEDPGNYSIVHVAASVIPTFNPGFRVWEYNVTDMNSASVSGASKPWSEFFEDLNEILEQEDASIETVVDRKKDKTFPPNPPSPNVTLGPAFKPQTFSPTGFVQYYLDLDKVNRGIKPFEYEVEYTSANVSGLDSILTADWLKLGKQLVKDQKSAKFVETEKKHKKKKDKKDKKKKKKHGKNFWEEYLQRVFVSTGYERLINEGRMQ